MQSKNERKKNDVYNVKSFKREDDTKKCGKYMIWKWSGSS